MKFIKNLKGLFKEPQIEQKSVVRVSSYEETTREGIQKAFMPKFLYKPPYGYPRFSDMPFIRALAQSPYVDMCIQTILDELCAVPWDIVVNEDLKDVEEDPEELYHIKNFLENPNENDEDFCEVFIEKPWRDVLEVNSGVIVKTFTIGGELAEVKPQDGATFTKNPNIHGMYTDRADVLLPKIIVDDNNTSPLINPGFYSNPDTISNSHGYGTGNPYNISQMTGPYARENAAYFQYGWTAGPVPIPFGKKEIIWIERQKRTDEHYGPSPVMILAKVLRTLGYYIEGDLEYFIDNNLPKGILGLLDANSEEIEAYKEQWKDVQYKQDEFGNWKKAIHRVPMVGTKPEFTRFEFTAAEMQALEKQKWWTKVVWACFGVTPTELGFTDDAKGSANQIVQSKVFRKKAVNPALRSITYKINKEILPHFGYTHMIKKGNKSIEVQKYKFKFLIEDTDELKSKAELNKERLDTIYTVNEVRKMEGLEPIEGGDEAPKGAQPTNSFNFNSPGNLEESFQGSKKRSEGENQNISNTPKINNPGKKEEKALTKKKRKILNDEVEEIKKLCKENNISTSDVEDWIKEKKEKEKGCGKKSQDPSKNPLMIKEGEKISSPKRLEAAFQFLFSRFKSESFKILAAGALTEQMIEKIVNSFSVTEVKQILDSLIKTSYLEGIEDVGKELDRNFLPDNRAIAFLENYTFDNIKGMQEDIANKLRQELQRGFMNGEGITDLKNRVKKVMKVSDNRAKMIARTESTRASNAGRLKAYIEAGVKGKKKYNAIIDNKTSEICKRLNGQEVSLDACFEDKISGWKGQHPPAHVNCRSTFDLIIEKPKE